jgi:WD40 repeat protein
MRVSKWSINDDKELASVTLPNIPMMVDWGAGHADPENVAILLKPGIVALWDGNSSKINPLDNLKEGNHTCIRWNHGGKPATLAVGRADGTVLIYDKSRNKIAFKIEPPANKDQSGNNVKTGEVIDIQWDPLSNQYLLAVYRSGAMALLDAASGEILQNFTSPTHSVEMVAFLPSHPGDFVTVNNAAATLTVWNVSQQKYKEIIKVDSASAWANGLAAQKRCGILSVKLVPS